MGAIQIKGRAISVCVLVVEDDFLIRLMLVEELQNAGYEVREAATGDQALALLEDIDPPLRILITDIHMPGRLSGLDLATHVREIHPLVPIIYTTGRPDALAHLHRLDKNQALVRKPYIPDEVIGKIHKLLNS